MSNNLYNILGKLAALTPKEEPKQETKEIYESVEAQGSVLEGVAKVEAALSEKYMGFKKLEKSIAAKGDVKDPAAVAAAIGREKYGKKKFQKAAATGKKLGEETLDEKAPPGMEDMVLKLKKQYPGEPEKAFATAWSIYNKKHSKKEESIKEESVEAVAEESDYDVKDTGYSKIYQRKVKDTDPDADDEDDKPAVKQGRGRPKKADKDKSHASLPWGGKPPKVDANPTKKWPKEKTRVHKISESVNFKRMMEETGMTLDEMLGCLSADMKNYKETGHMSEMLRDCMEVFSHGKKQIADETVVGTSLPAAQIPGKQDLLKTPVTPWEKAKAVVKDTAKGIMGRDDVEHFGTGKPVDESGLETELNELAKLAGITDEGNAFGKAVRDAKADGIQPGEKVSVGGREYPVKEATTLEDIAKLSGIAIEGKDYGDTKVEKAPEYANTPDEEVEGEEVLTKGGDGEVAGKEKAMHADKPTWKNADNALTKESVNPIESLGRKLMAAYESIKLSK